MNKKNTNKKKIQKHRAKARVQVRPNVAVLDCITLLISKLLMPFVKDNLVDEAPCIAAVQKEINELISLLHIYEQDWFIVSNEAGLGLVPPYQMGRVYRDAIGWSNQRLAREADKVILMVAGIPTVIK